MQRPRERERERCGEYNCMIWSDSDKVDVFSFAFSPYVNSRENPGKICLQQQYVVILCMYLSPVENFDRGGSTIKAI